MKKGKAMALLSFPSSRIWSDGQVFGIEADAIIINSGKFDPIKRRINRLRAIAVSAVRRVNPGLGE